MLHAEQGARLAPRISAERPEVTLQEAYRVQWAGAALRVSAGARVVGHKVGLTSKAMQEQFGIGEPDSGLLLDTARVADDGAVLVADLIAPRVEAEIAFLLGAPLAGERVSEEQARAAVSGVVLALEVIDSRAGTAGLTLADSVADNAACARFAVGTSVPVEGLDLAAEQVLLTVGGRTQAAGAGSAVLGDPLRSLVWLARRLAPFGCWLRPGDLVLAGAVHASVPLLPGSTVTARSPHLPAVRLHAA
ncbi:2-hydroxypenta-2,4-dienoate hydratase [Peterkaempfera bronchialis]|uniref:2-hydroxypenta-2,4-dienoate hydratase n=1 Tax=Peterkaempfera bronchialis TaxID=2126346 RepID=A0A345T5D3_9ACTN|nr:2-hydroxypenta-2,4-dienoate hydratase [Peterkaempfera bronchialis]